MVDPVACGGVEGGAGEAVAWRAERQGANNSTAAFRGHHEPPASGPGDCDPAQSVTLGVLEQVHDLADFSSGVPGGPARMSGGTRSHPPGGKMRILRPPPGLLWPCHWRWGSPRLGQRPALWVRRRGYPGGRNRGRTSPTGAGKPWTLTTAAPASTSTTPSTGNTTSTTSSQLGSSVGAGDLPGSPVAAATARVGEIGDRIQLPRASPSVSDWVGR